MALIHGKDGDSMGEGGGLTANFEYWIPEVQSPWLNLSKPGVICRFTHELDERGYLVRKRSVVVQLFNIGGDHTWDIWPTDNSLR